MHKKLFGLILGALCATFSLSGGSYCVYNDCCPADVALDCCNPWTLHLEYFVWQPRCSNLFYATTDSQIAFIPDENGVPDDYVFAGGKIATVDPDWESGFRVGIGSRMCDLDYGLTYTYFRGKSYDYVDSTTNGIVSIRIPIELREAQAYLNFVQGSYLVDYDQFDLESGYTHLIDCYNVALRPFAGFRAAFIDQEFTSDIFREKSAFEGEVLAPLNLRCKEKLDMGAYGFYGGLDGSYGLCKGISLFAKGSAGIYVAHFDGKNTTTNLSNNERLTTVTGDFWQHVCSCNFTIGLQYELCEYMCADWKMRVGYEINQWYSMPDLLRASTLYTPGLASLGFDGITLSVDASF